MKSTRTAFLVIALAALVSCTQTEENRNIALHRAAYHSSAIDYYYTAQLVTDGIIEDGVPVYYEVLENGYGISMRSLVLFAEKTYLVDDGMDPLKKAISVLERQIADGTYLPLILAGLVRGRRSRSSMWLPRGRSSPMCLRCATASS